jgi:transcriptional regulator with XRE-family HTH domain
MIVYDSVNDHLRRSQYLAGVADKRRTPGSRKGDAKPVKRKLDPAFHSRLKAAMRGAGYSHNGNGELDVPRLAKEVGCTRAVIHKYLKPGESKTIEALLLFAIADKLGVAARWLLKSDGQMGREDALTPDQKQALNLFSLLSQHGRDLWMEQGAAIRRSEPPLMPTSVDPYSTAARTVHEPDPKKQRA